MFVFIVPRTLYVNCLGHSYIECDPGYHYVNISCIKCPRNTTQENKGQMTCNICPSSRPITENEGTVSQTDCIGGK